MAIIKVGHARLLVTDLDAAARYYTDTLGLLETGRRSGEIYLKAVGEQDHHCLVLQQSDRAGLAHLGFKVNRVDDLDHLERLAARAGSAVQRLAPGEELGLGEAIAFELPSGHRALAYFAVENRGWGEGMDDPDPVRGDLTGNSLRSNWFDHAAITVPDPQDFLDYLTEVLDFGVSEILLGPDQRCAAAWTYCSNTQHDLAIVPGPPGGLHHLSFYAESRAAVVAGADLLRSRRVPLMDFGLSRHGIAGVTTVYFHDPAGNRNELFYGPYPTPGVPGKVQPVVWRTQDFPRGAFYYENALDERFMSEIT